MPDIFISYSRQEQDVADQLVQALEDAGKQVWIDRANIRPLAAWKDEIQSAIDATAAFLFLITPRSLRSEQCREELSYAVKAGKKIIPVFVQPVEQVEIPEDLSQINWINYRDKAETQRAAGEVISALETDLLWTKEHARLTVRCHEWQSNHFDNSFLLRGRDLTKAEAWLVSTPANSTNLSRPLHEYVLTSRKASTRSLQRVVFSMAVALVLIVVLAIASFIQYRRALSQSYAAQSFIQLKDRLDSAIRLAALSFKSKDTPEARGALALVLEQNPRLVKVINAEDGAVRALTFSSDGLLMASGGMDNSVTVWDTKTFRKLGKRLDGHTSTIAALVFSPKDSNVLVSGGMDATIQFWDIADFTKSGPVLHDQRYAISSLAYSSDGSKLVSSSYDGTVEVWNASSKTKICRSDDYSLHNVALLRSVLRVSFSPDDKTIASVGDDGAVSIWDPATCTLSGPVMQASVANPNVRNSLMASTSLAFNAGGNILASGYADGTVRIWNFMTRRLIGTIANNTKEIRALSFSGAGQELLIASADSTVSVINPITRMVTRAPLMGNRNGIFALSVKNTTSIVATGDGDGQVYVWDLARPSGLAESIFQITQSKERLQGLAVSPENSSDIVAGYSNGDIAFVNLKNKTASVFASGHGEIKSVGFSGHASVFAVGFNDGTVQFWDFKNRQPLGEPIVAGRGPIASVFFFPDNRGLCTGVDNARPIIISATTHAIVSPPLRGYKTSFTQTAISPSGDSVAWVKTEGTSSSIELLGTGSLPTAPRDLEAPGGLAGNNLILSLAFSRDGQLIAGGTSNGSLYMWRLRTQKLLGRPIVFHQNAITALAFSWDGKMIAAGDSNGGMFLIDVQSTQQVGPLLQLHAGSIRYLAFMRNSSELLSAGSEGKIVQWDIDGKSLYEKACLIVAC